MAKVETYNITFTAGAAMIEETCAVAEAYVESKYDWETTKERTFKENLMNKTKVSSNQRYFVLMKQRISALTPEELQRLVDGTMAEKRIIVLLAICKAHSFVYDFITENVRESYFGLNEKISHANFNEFYNEKKYEHPELEEITEQTTAKMRQVIFRILEQTEIIESADDAVLRRPYLSESLEKMIVKDDAKWLTAFLYSNNEISSLSELYA